MNKSIFKYPALITYLVRTLQVRYPDKQIGKTIIQKMIYLLTLRGLIDIRYSMYYYGPYSQEVTDALNLAENTGAVEIKWVNDEGYFIHSKPGFSEKFEHLLDEHEKGCIADIVETFGGLKSNELSIIATGLYLKSNFEIPNEKLMDAIRDIKPQYSKDYIKNVLEKGGILCNL